MPKVNALAMSDEDFLNLPSADELPEATAPAVVEKTPEQLAAEAEAANTNTEQADATGGEGGNAEPTEEEKAEAARLKAEKDAEDDAGKGGVTEPTAEEKAEAERLEAEGKGKPALLVDPAKKPEPGTKEAKTPAEKPAASSSGSSSTETVNYEEAFKEIMKPFKANGKMIELKTPQEAIQLMQMGANYTRKLQELQPSKKLLMMLENNGLLDEGKLSFLIDLDKKNPEAIKKLVKDSGLNVAETDFEAEPAYQAGNHVVTDAAAVFKSTLEEVRSLPKGQDSLTRFNTDWDQASKEVLWTQPALMPVMHQQIESGIYDQIETEISRRRTLGQIPTTTPFLDAYKLVGDEMLAQGKFGKVAAATTTNTSGKTPVATTVATPKAAVTNGAQASAASPSRSTPRATGKTINPLAMADDEFLKQMTQRL